MPARHRPPTLLHIAKKQADPHLEIGLRVMLCNDHERRTV